MQLEAITDLPISHIHTYDPVLAGHLNWRLHSLPFQFINEPELPLKSEDLPSAEKECRDRNDEQPELSFVFGFVLSGRVEPDSIAGHLSYQESLDCGMRNK